MTKNLSTPLTKRDPAAQRRISVKGAIRQQENYDPNKDLLRPRKFSWEKAGHEEGS